MRFKLIKQNRLIQIDILKGIAILFVIIAHSLTSKILGKILYLFYLEQAVPVFVIVMGINLYFSLQKNKSFKFRDIYTKSYFKKRAARILIPFSIIFVAALIVGLIMKQTQFSWLMVLGKLPFHGPGNYYLSFVLQFTVLAPLMYILFVKKPVLTLVAGFLISLIFEISAPHIGFLNNGSYLYSSSFFRYMPGVLMGFWLASNNFKLKKMYLALIPLPLVLYYIFLVDTSPFYIPFFLPDWGSQNLLTVIYPAFLIMIGVRIFSHERKSDIITLVSFLGRSSYHIFLVQIIYFGVIRQTSVMDWPVILRLGLNLFLCIGLGLLLLFADNWINKRWALKKSRRTNESVLANFR